MSIPSTTDLIRQTLEDPVTFDLMEEAVTVLPCGHSFSKKTVESLQLNNQPCPLDRIEIASFIPNYSIRSAIFALSDRSNLEVRSNEAPSSLDPTNLFPSSLISPPSASPIGNSGNEGSAKSEFRSSSPPMYEQKNKELAFHEPWEQYEPPSSLGPVNLFTNPSASLPSAPPLSESEDEDPLFLCKKGETRPLAQNETNKVLDKPKVIPAAHQEPSTHRRIAHSSVVVTYSETLPSNYIRESAVDILFSACEHDDTERLVDILDRGVDINIKKVYATGEVKTPLLIAVEKGNLKLGRLLIQRGANPNVTCIRQSPYVVVFERASGAKLSNLVEEWTPLHSACMCIPASSLNERAVLANELIESGANVNAQNSDQDTPILLACTGGNTKLVETLIRNGANVKAKSVIAQGNSGNFTFCSCLSNAAQYGHVDTLKILIEHGASPSEETQKDSKSNPLIQAALKGNVDVAQILIENGANIQTHFGKESALSVAVVKSNYNMVDFLLKQGANPNDSITTKRWASSVKDRINSVEKEYVHTFRGSILINACIIGELKVVEALLNAGADVSQKGFLVYSQYSQYNSSLPPIDKEKEISALYAASKLAPPNVQAELKALLKARGASDCVIS